MSPELKRFEEVTAYQPEQAQGNYFLGLVHLERGDLEAAKDCLLKAAQSSADPYFLNALGLAYLEYGLAFRTLLPNYLTL